MNLVPKKHTDPTESGFAILVLVQFLPHQTMRVVTCMWRICHRKLTYLPALQNVFPFLCVNYKYIFYIVKN